MNSKISFEVTFFVLTLFACAQIAKCAPAGESTLHTSILSKQSTINPKPESASDSSSNELGNAISPLNNEPDLLDVLAPSRRNRVSDQSQIKFPILTTNSRDDLYNNIHETQRQRGDEIKTAEAGGADGDKVSGIYNLLSEIELGEYSESYEGGSLSQSESEEEDDGDGDIFIDCTSSGCSEVDENEVPSEGMQLIIPRIGDDNETVTLEELDVMMNDIILDMVDLRACLQLYKYRLTKNASSTEPTEIPSSTTLNKFEVFRDILECKIWIGTLRSFIENIFSEATMSQDKQSNLNKPIGSISSGPQQLPSEDHNGDDDEEQALSVLFASDLQYGIATPLTSNEDSSHPEKAALEISSTEEKEEVDIASEPTDLKPSTFGFKEPPKNLLQNEDAHVSENESLVLIIEQGSNDTAAHSNPKKNLFHPLLIFPILLCSLIFSCILGTAYNKCMGRSEDRTKILKVPRMAIFSDAPLNSTLFPPVTEAKVHSMKKQGIEVV